MGYHVVNNGSTITVHTTADNSSQTQIGEIYNGEVYTVIEPRGTRPTVNSDLIYFLNASGKYVRGYCWYQSYGNLAFYGTPTTLSGVSCYRFKLRNPLQVVSTSGGFVDVLTSGDFVYTNSADCGHSNPANMYIIGYKKKYDSAIAYKGFVMLDFTAGSMLNSNFCLAKG